MKDREEMFKYAEDFNLLFTYADTRTWQALGSLTGMLSYPFTTIDKAEVIRRIREGAELLRGASTASTGESVHVLQCPVCLTYPVGFRAIFAGKPEEVCLFRCPGCKRESEGKADLMEAARAWNRKVLGNYQDVLELQEFYEIAQTYRHADFSPGGMVQAAEAFEAIKAFIRKHFMPKK